ncbi:hypothetical protein [Ancylobacter polymorphus]|uniref:Uncharacterized protein n=1 Tax=Ancylobacter polymorphus TaxID=223390 RepID=A0A9E7CVX7_9HYPH|nr:hypothetical protein [Ancylobacter polymorphus]UOK71738.1 hypothetical protein K9D25_03145 [Ancylobacter polymorphus]
MLRKGQKVACISTAELGMLGYGDERYPTQGETYTIRDIVVDHFGAEGVLLDEIRNDRLPYRVGDKIVDFEKPFASWRFRPLVESEQTKEMEAV